MSDLAGQSLPSSAWRTVLVDGREAIEGEVLVRFRTPSGGFEEARARADVEADQSETIARNGLRRWRARRLGTRALIARLRANPDVEFVEPNYLIRVAAVPNDTYINSLWGLFNWGQAITGSPGIAGADIDAANAWEISTGSRDHVVGIIDTGIDYNHPDLAANIWSAPSAFSVTIGGVIINCAAGTHGFNAINNTCNPMDDHAHGTHVAGTIGAVGNNGIGVAGVNWVASMMGLKFLSASGSGSTSDAIKAIDFAIQAKAAFAGTGAADVRVLSNSWGGGGFSQALLDAINRANNANMLFVAAAGNNSSNTDSVENYPSNYAAANVVSVAAMTNRDQRSSFSNYGALTVDLGAPGSSILSTTPNNTYSYFNGTSMATPHVAGAAALLLAACTLDTAGLKSALMVNVTPVAAMAGVTVTGGRLNVNNAIRVCPPIANPVPVLSSIAPANVVVAGPAPTVTLNGSNFVTGSQARVDGVVRATTFVSSTQLTVNLTAGDVATIGARWLTVYSPTPGGGTSAAIALNVIPIPTISVNGSIATSTVNPASALTVGINGGPGNATDWAGLFATGASDAQSLEWRYLNGLTTLPLTGLSNANLSFTVPAQTGTYEIRFYGKGWVRMATSATLTVTTSSRLTIDDVSVTEGNSGATMMTFAVRLAPVNSLQTVTVAYATANLTAMTGDLDYVAASGTLTFAPGVATRPVTITINGDTKIEPHEAFALNLSNAVNAVIDDSQGIGRILNDEGAPTPTVTAPALVDAGAAIPVLLANGPANLTDWVGLFAVGATDQQSLQWQYLNGLTLLPGVGISNATLQFVAPLRAGSYEVRLYAKGWVKLATSAVITVTSSSSGAPSPSPPSSASLTLLATTVSPGGAIQVALANGPGTPTDWVGLFAVGAADPQALQWQYLNGLTTAPSVGVTNGSFNLTAPLQSGHYEIRLYAKGYVRLATSPMITVSQGSPTLTASSTARPGGSIQVVVTNSPGTPTDWVGLFPLRAGDAQSVQWQYLNGQTTLPVAGISNVNLQFVGPPAGSYEIRLYAKGYARLATSGTIIVAP